MTGGGVMRRKNKSRLQITIAIVCICFFIGVLTGALSEREINSYQCTALTDYSSNYLGNVRSFGELFIKHGKYILSMWLCGFIMPGAVIILIIIFVSGIFYGFSSAFMSGQYGVMYAVEKLMPYNMLLIPVYIFTAVWTILYVLRRYSNYGPKSRIRRERRKHMSEHVVILFLCLALNAAVCAIENIMH